MMVKTCRHSPPPHARQPARARCALGLALALLAALAAPATGRAATGLKAMSLEQLLEVPVVGASKYEQRQGDVAAAVSVITRQEIRAFGWRTLDAALASLPGVYSTYDRQYAYIGTRGFSVPGDFNTRVLLTINGNRVNDAVYDQAYIGRDFPLDMDMVERIEFIPGPGGAVYGQNAMFGVVNVVTRSAGSIDGTELAVLVQRPQRQGEARATWGRQFDSGLDVLLSASGLHAHGADRPMSFGAADVSGVARGLDGERDREVVARAALGPWVAELVAGDRRKDDPTGVYRSDPLVPGTYQRDRMVLAQLLYQDRVGDALQLSGRLFRGSERYHAPETYDGSRTALTVASDWAGLEARVVSTAITSHKLMLGLEYQHNLRQDQYFDDFVATPDLVDVAVLRNGWRLGIFVQDEWSITDRLSATLGLRVDRNNTTSRAVSPRAGVIWKAGADTTLKTLYGRAHRAPNVYERDYTDGATLIANNGLRAEYIETLEAVAEHVVRQGLVLRASAYRWAMTDLIGLAADSADGPPQYQNGDKVGARGLELSVDSQWANATRLRASLSLQRAVYSGGTPLYNSPRLLARANLSAPLPWAGASAGVEWRHDSSRITLDGSALPGVSLVNAHVGFAVAPGLEVSLGVQNLFGARYAQPGSRNNWQNALEQDGRSISARLDCRF
jgi:outer membrane receptor protein involved in Fe transport